MTPDPVQKPVMHSADAISLRDYVDLRFVELQRTLDKGEESLNDRLHAMNEIREHLREQAMAFITRQEINIKNEAMCEDIQELQRLAAEQKGKASQTAMIFVAAMSLAGLVLGILQLVITGK